MPSKTKPKYEVKMSGMVYIKDPTDAATIRDLKVTVKRLMTENKRLSRELSQKAVLDNKLFQKAVKLVGDTFIEAFDWDDFVNTDRIVAVTNDAVDRELIELEARYKRSLNELKKFNWKRIANAGQ